MVQLILLYPETGTTATLLASVSPSDNNFRSSTTGFTAGGYAKVADELIRLNYRSYHLKFLDLQMVLGLLVHSNGAATVAIGASTAVL